jgi:hypothetical protein
MLKLLRSVTIGINMNLSRLTLLGFTHKKNGSKYGDFQCICGNKINVVINSVVTGNTKSCGCMQKELRNQRKYVNHGMCNTPTYKSWMSMKARCRDKNKIHHHGKGITFCDRWLKFENFLADMGERPEGMTIDRINNQGNYEPSNCKWSSPIEQAQNRSSSVVIHYKGEKIPLKKLAESVGMKWPTLARRLRAGMDVETAVSKPLAKR